MKRSHAGERAVVRYGLDLTPADFDEMLQIIRAGGAIEVSDGRLPKNYKARQRKVFELVWKNRYWRVVIHRMKFVVTVLPLSAKKKYQTVPMNGVVSEVA